jgi:hypothetical protein
MQIWYGEKERDVKEEECFREKEARSVMSDGIIMKR